MRFSPRTRHETAIRIATVGVLWAALLGGTAAGAAGQRAPIARWGEVFAGGELEQYLRLEQILGQTALYPWGIRELSPRELERIAPRGEQPWGERYALVRPAGRGAFEIHPPAVGAIVNSGFPYGMNDGPIWAGRGVTGWAQAGFSLSYGPLSFTAAPLLYWSQNAAFPLQPPQGAENSPLLDPMRPRQIDLPQRFGLKPFTRIDPGQTSVRLEGRGFAAGLSTADQSWGPATTFPILVGNNAPGFLHAFAGTSHPWDFWVGTGYGRLIYGRIGQSPYAEIPADSSKRFMAGMVASFTPRGVPGLEIGGTRFFHTPWPHGGLQPVNLLKPFESFAKLDFNRRGEEVFSAIADNQLASVFFRWTLPHSGFETYGEYAREDNSQNLRDLTLEPDHDAAYMLGFQKAWQRSPTRFVAVQAELVNATRSHLFLGRRQEPYYVHGVTRQGHTSLGQIIGSPAAYDGAGSVLSTELYDPRGRLTARWTRLFRQGEVGAPPGDQLAPGRFDVTHALGVDGLLFRGRYDLAAGLTTVYEWNRYQKSNAFNLNGTASIRVPL